MSILLATFIQLTLEHGFGLNCEGPLTGGFFFNSKHYSIT